MLPTAVLFHGGGWVTGNKDEIALDVLPYLAMGFAVVNVDYRVARMAPAPAAVQDSRCALRWVIRHAPQYGFDPARLVLVGSSAGAHLALMAALAPATAGFDGLCPGNEPLTVAAVINFFGVVDVAELLAPPHPRDFAVGWIGPGADAAARAARGCRRSATSPRGRPPCSPCTATPIPSFRSRRRRACTRRSIASARRTAWFRSAAAGTAISTATRSCARPTSCASSSSSAA